MQSLHKAIKPNIGGSNMKIYRVIDFDTEESHHGFHVTSMSKAKIIAKDMNDPQIDCIEFNNDKQSIINELNVAAGHRLIFRDNNWRIL